VTASNTLLARTTLGKNLKVRKGESVVIETWTHGLPYVGSFVEEARRLGAEPLVIYEDEGAWWSAVGQGRPKSASAISAAERAALQSADVFVYFWGPEDRPRVDALPDKVAGGAFATNPDWYKIGRKAGLRGCRMSVAFATDPIAKLHGLNGDRWRTKIATAGLADAQRMYATGSHLAKVLEDGSELRIRHRNGTDLTLGLAKREVRVETGVLDKAAMGRPFGFLTNSPAGTVMTGLDESKADGTFASNLSHIQPDLRTPVGRWEFSGGKLVSFQYEGDAEEIAKRFKAAGEGKDRPGLLSIGLNPKGRGVPMYEEIESGIVLLGIGGNQFLGGRNKLPFQLFSLLRGADLEVDGKPVVRAGRVG